MTPKQIKFELWQFQLKTLHSNSYMPHVMITFWRPWKKQSESKNVKIIQYQV